jgi:two-component system OmpR family sensor kinase/two-component system sensor histidine kinase BaeS
MNRLWVRLTLAFAAVIIMSAVTIALLAGLTASHAFRRYLSYSDSSLHQALNEQLVEYYRLQGSWEGVEYLMGGLMLIPRPMRRPPPHMMPGTVDIQDAQIRIVLADEDNRVVYDSLDPSPSRRLSRDERAAAQDVVLNDEVIGHLVIAWPIRSDLLGPLEQSFVERLRWLLIAGTLVAAALGVVLSVILSRSLAAPLQRLATAARAIADRDFSRRVEVEGSVEMAEVSQAFNEMAETLEHSERQRQNMVADVAHELRSPLTILQGNLQAILDDVYPLEKAEVSRLYDETRLLARLVDDLRELALADAGQLRLNLVPTDVAQVAGALADSLAPVVEAQAATLQLQVPEDLPPVRADPDRVAQVLRNLLLNALYHTPAGGSIQVMARQAGDFVEVAVSDTGEGIAPEDLAHVFDRFWRGDRARTREGRWGSGSGLGLSIAQSLIEVQGGRIWAESKPGQGSIFRFSLPLAAGDPSPARPAGAQPA